MNTAGRGARRSGPRRSGPRRLGTPVFGAPGVRGPQCLGPPAFGAPGVRGPRWGVDPPSPQLRSLSRGRPKPAPPWGVTIWLQKSPLSIGGGEKGVLKGIGLFQKGLPRQVHPVRPRSHGGRRSHPLSPSSKTPQRLKAHPPWPVLPAAPCAPQGLPSPLPRHCQPPRKSMGSSESRGGGAGGEAAGALSSCFHACCPPQGIRTPPHCLARPGPVVWCPGPFSTCVSLGTGANDARGEGRGSRGGAGLMARRCGQPPRAGPSAWGQRPLRSLLWAVRSQPPGPDQPCPCLPESVATGLSIPEHSLGTGSDLGALGRPFSAAPSRTFCVLSSECRGADSGLGAISSVGPQPVQQGREGPSTRLWGASSDPPSLRRPRHAQELGDTLPPLSH